MATRIIQTGEASNITSQCVQCADTGCFTRSMTIRYWAISKLKKKKKEKESEKERKMERTKEWKKIVYDYFSSYCSRFDALMKYSFFVTIFVNNYIVTSFILATKEYISFLRKFVCILLCENEFLDILFTMLIVYSYSSFVVFESTAIKYIGDYMEKVRKKRLKIWN